MSHVDDDDEMGLTDDSASSCPTDHGDDSCNSYGEDDDVDGDDNTSSDEETEPPDNEEGIEISEKSEDLTAKSTGSELGASITGEEISLPSEGSEAKKSESDISSNSSKKSKETKTDEYQNAKPKAQPKLEKVEKEEILSPFDKERKELEDHLKSGVKGFLDGVLDMARHQFALCQTLLGPKNGNKLLDCANYLTFKYCYITTLIMSESLDDIKSSRDHLAEMAEFAQETNVDFPLVKYLWANHHRRWNDFDGVMEVCEQALKRLKNSLAHSFYYPSVDSDIDAEIIPESDVTFLLEKFTEMITECKGLKSAEPLMECKASRVVTMNGQYKPKHRRSVLYDTDPDRTDFVQLECGNKCRICYHMQCWRDIKKENCLTQKNLEHGMCPCFTEDCDGFITKFSTWVIDQSTDEYKLIEMEMNLPSETHSPFTNSQKKSAKRTQEKSESVNDKQDLADRPTDVPCQNCSSSFHDRSNCPKENAEPSPSLSEDTTQAITVESDMSQLSYSSVSVPTDLEAVPLAKHDDEQYESLLDGTKKMKKKGKRKVQKENILGDFEIKKGQFFMNAGSHSDYFGLSPDDASTFRSRSTSSGVSSVAEEEVLKTLLKDKDSKAFAAGAGSNTPVTVQAVVTDVTATTDDVSNSSEEMDDLREEMENLKLQVEMDGEKIKELEREKKKLGDNVERERGEIVRLNEKLRQSSTELTRERDRAQSHKDNVERLKSEKAELEQLVLELESNQEKTQKDKQTVEVELNRAKEQLQVRDGARKEQFEERARVAELSVVQLKRDVEIAKLRRDYTRINENIQHCELIIRGLADNNVEYANSWRTTLDEWRQVADTVERVIYEVGTRYELLAGGLRDGMSLAMLEPVQIPAIPAAPRFPPPPHVQQEQAATRSGFFGQPPASIYTQSGQASATPSPPIPGLVKAGFQARESPTIPSNPLYPPSVHVSATPSPPIPTPVSIKTSLQARGLPPPGFSPKSAFTKPVIERQVASGSTHSSSNGSIATPVQQKPKQEPIQKSEQKEGKMKSIDDIVGHVQKFIPGIERTAVIQQLVALREKSGGKIKGSREELVTQIVMALTGGTAPVEPQAAQASPVVRQRQSSHSERDYECPICHEDMRPKNKDHLEECPMCLKRFCAKCVLTWLHQKATCPMCTRHWVLEDDFPRLSRQ